MIARNLIALDLVPLLRTLFAERQTTALYVTHESREAVVFDARRRAGGRPDNGRWTAG